MHLAAGLVWVALLAPLAQEPAVPVEDEPNHRTVLENDSVQAFRVTLPPGKSTRMHTHSRDDAAVRLNDATISQETPGKPASPGERVLRGAVSARDNEAKPFTHQVHNVGDTVFDVIDLQVLKRPAGLETEAVTTPAAESSRLRVYRYELAAGASSPEHAHARPYAVVAATDMTVRMASPDGAAMEHDLHAGDVHWVDAAVTHTLTNSGTANGVLVEIELK